MGFDFCNDTQRLNLTQLFGTKRDLDIKPLYTYLCPVIIFICFFSIIFNAILMSISRQSKVVNKSPILLLSLNLAVTDLIASLLNGLGILFNSYLPEVHDIKMGQCSMLMFEVVRCAALVASALHLLALAFVHYRGIVNPLHYRSTIFFSQHLSRTINIISIACWIIPLTIMIAWFSSSPCQGFQSPECDYLFLLGFTYRYMVLTLFALPLLLMSIIYLRIFIIISRHQKGRRINHERSTLTRGVISAAGPIGTAAAVNLPELIAKTDVARCAACAARAIRDEDDPTVSILSEESSEERVEAAGRTPHNQEVEFGQTAFGGTVPVSNKSIVSEGSTQGLHHHSASGDSKHRPATGSVSTWSQSSASRGSSSGRQRLGQADSMSVTQTTTTTTTKEDSDCGGGGGGVGREASLTGSLTSGDDGDGQSVARRTAELASAYKANSSRNSRITPDMSSSAILTNADKQPVKCNSGNEETTLPYNDCDNENGKNQHTEMLGEERIVGEKDVNNNDHAHDGISSSSSSKNRVAADVITSLGREISSERAPLPKTTNATIMMTTRLKGPNSRLNKSDDKNSVAGDLPLKPPLAPSSTIDGNCPPAAPGSGRQQDSQNDTTTTTAIMDNPETLSRSSIRATTTKTVYLAAPAESQERLGAVQAEAITAATTRERQGDIEGLDRQRTSSHTSSGSSSVTAVAFRPKAALKAQYSLGANSGSWRGKGGGGCGLSQPTATKEVQLLTLPSGRISEPKFVKRKLQRSGQLSLDPQQQQQQSSGLAWGCTCDSGRSRQLSDAKKLTRANTIGDNSSRAGPRSSTAKTNRAMVITSQRSSISSSMVVPSQLAKSHLRRTPTQASRGGGGGSVVHRQQQEFSRSTGGATNYSIANTGSTYEPQRRHIHASAVPQTNTKALVTTLLILGTYFISYVPAIIYQVLTCIDNCPYPLYTISFSRRVLLGAMTTLLLIAKSIIDPFIYSYRMSEIQVAINRYLSKRRSKSSMATSMHTSHRIHFQQTNNNNNNNNNGDKINSSNSATQANSSFKILSSSSNTNKVAGSRTTSTSTTRLNPARNQSSVKNKPTQQQSFSEKLNKCPNTSGSNLETDQTCRLLDTREHHETIAELIKDPRDCLPVAERKAVVDLTELLDTYSDTGGAGDRSKRMSSTGTDSYQHDKEPCITGEHQAADSLISLKCNGIKVAMRDLPDQNETSLSDCFAAEPSLNTTNNLIC